jgi:hypothetical protein
VKKIQESVTQLSPGPTEIRRKVGGVVELIGYSLVQFDSVSETYESYFVLKADTQLPVPLENMGDELTFERIDAPQGSPENFYAWVLENGDLGEDVETGSATEQYSDWNP